MLPFDREGALGSRLGRKLLLLLALATLLPIGALALLADLNVASALRQARDAELAQHAKTYAIAVFERLLLVDASMRESQLGDGGALRRTRLADEVGGMLSAIALLDGRGVVLDAVGADMLPGEEARTRVAAAVAALDAGQAALLPLAVSGNDVRLLMLRVTAAEPRRVLAAVLAPAFVWGDADLNPVMTGFCVVSGELRLHCPAPMPAVLPLDQLDDGRRHGLVWDAGGEPQRAAGWTLFIRSRFSGADWVVFAVQPESYATAPTRMFRLTFVPVAIISLIAVLWLATRLVRKIGVPIRNLLRGTERLAKRDFEARVVVTDSDELGQLARAFNAMAARLALQFGTLRAMARIDRAILNSVNLGEVAVNSVRCLRHIVSSNVISVGLVQPDSPGRVLVQTRRRGARGVEKIEIDWPAAHTAGGGATPELPSEYLLHLALRSGGSMRILPIARGGSFWGVVVLGDESGQELDADRAAMLSGVVDRLAVALSTAARDWRLHVQANYDPLTGLPNRVHLLMLLTQHIAQAQREQQTGAVLFVDLDRFKQTNDTLGHAAGDTLLRLAAQRIRLSLRESDMVARIGGDEFAVVLPRIGDARDAGRVAANLIAALANAFEIDGQKLYAGGSVGIAIFPQDGLTPEELLKRADTAMYRAKDQGRGRLEFFDESMGEAVSARAALDRELRQAIERGEFVLHYQPQVDLRSGTISSVEALLRWRHPTRGLLGPGEFIEFAEDSGLIEAIGSWVLKTACEQHRQWEGAGVAIPRVAVNVSNRQLKQPGFLGEIDRALMLARRAPAQLEIEITESLVVDGGESAMRTLRDLQRAGVHVAIDDFGTGYSSFGYLRTIPATILKLDRAFVIDLADNVEAQVIASAMIRMAQTLCKEVVVEGVETSEQLTLLAKFGADRIQGYLICRPVSAPKLVEFMRTYEIARGKAASRPQAALSDAAS